MKRLIIIAGLLVAFDGWAYNETDLAKLKALNACESCDLSGANLKRANLVSAQFYPKANLSRADLYGANLSGAKYCKTQMPWGKLNNDC